MTRSNLPQQDVAALYDRHAPWLVGYACSLLGERAAAEDVVQQVFARLLRGDVATPSNPLAYLCRAIRNAVLNRRRSLGREVAWNESALAWLEAPPGLHDVALAIETALQQLPAEQREVLILHVWGQLTFAEIGDAADCSPHTVASRYRYGLAKLRDLLRPLPND